MHVRTYLDQWIYFKGVLDTIGKTSCLSGHVYTYTYVDPAKYSRIQDSDVMAQTSAWQTNLPQSTWNRTLV